MEIENHNDPVAAFYLAVLCFERLNLSPERQLSELKSMILRWRAGDKVWFGLMADEVEKYAPEAVQVDPRTGFKVVDYGIALNAPGPGK